MIPQKQVRYHDGMDDTCFTAFLRCPYRMEKKIFTDKQHLATDLARSPRTISPGEQWCKLICERFYTQTLLHTDAFTHKSFYTKRLLHTDGFTHRRFYTQTLLHADAFYTRTHAFTHKRFYTQTRLHTDAFTRRCFLHTQTHFHTQTLLHTDAFKHRHFYTNESVHRNFFSVFDVQRPFRAKGLRLTK